MLKHVCNVRASIYLRCATRRNAHVYFFLRVGGVARIRRGPLGIAPADRSGDKAAETELTTCWTVLATDVPE